jgi:arylsulfatase A-like enzyme
VNGLSLGRFALLGLVVGLGVGVVEALAVVMLVVFYPQALSWRTANSFEVLFVAPPVDALAFAGLAVAVGSLSRLFRWSRGDELYLGLAGGVAGWLAGSMPAILSWWAIAAIALGGAATAVRLYRTHRAWVLPRLGRIAMAGALVPLASAPIVLGTARLRRHQSQHGPNPASNRPNILLLVIDTQRADHLGLYGYDRPTSPTLDSLGARGLVFDRAVAPSSWTLPSHASMMTGRLQHEHRAGLLRQPLLDRRYPTVAEALSRSGYATAGFVGNLFWTGRRTGLDRGFGYYVDYYRNLGDAIARTTLGRILAYQVLPHFGLVDLPGRRRSPDLNADLVRWIDGLEGHPFFAFVNYFDVHPPLLPPAAQRGRFSPNGVIPTAGQIDIGALTGEMKAVPPEVLAERINRYDESILGWDAALAQLLAQLERRGLLRNTVIMVTSDHGESFGEHGLYFHGHSLYRDQIRVPLIVSWPTRITRPVRVADPVSLTQVPATLLAVAQVKDSTFPGPSLLDPAPSPGPSIAEVGRRSQTPLGWPSSIGWVAALVTRDWDLLVRQDGHRELYRSSDVAQKADLAQDSAQARVADSLGRSLPRTQIQSGLER